jgi:hypothetical protein
MQQKIGLFLKVADSGLTLFKKMTLNSCNKLFKTAVQTLYFEG